MFTDMRKRYQFDYSVLLEIYGGYNDKLNENENCIAIFTPLSEKSL
jgi:hypothetical protein